MARKKGILKWTDDELAIAGAGGGLVLGLLGVGIAAGALGAHLLKRFRGEPSAMGGGMFSGEDPIVAAAKKLG